ENNHADNTVSFRSDVAFFASRTNTACVASSASPGSPSLRRADACIHAQCRDTSSPNARCDCEQTNCSKSCASVMAKGANLLPIDRISRKRTCILPAISRCPTGHPAGKSSFDLILASPDGPPCVADMGLKLLRPRIRCDRTMKIRRPAQDRFNVDAARLEKHSKIGRAHV